MFSIWCFESEQRTIQQQLQIPPINIGNGLSFVTVLTPCPIQNSKWIIIWCFFFNFVFFIFWFCFSFKLMECIMHTVHCTRRTRTPHIRSVHINASITEYRQQMEPNWYFHLVCLWGRLVCN